MSWDVMLMAIRVDFDLPKGEQPDRLPPLGSREQVIAKLAAAVPGLDFSDPAWGILEGEGYSIEWGTGQEDLVDAISLHVRGGGQVLAAIEAACGALNAHALDVQTMEYIEFDRPGPAEQSWENFQAYRDRVIGQCGGSQ